MTSMPLNFAPGACKVDSEYASQSRYSDMNKIRFVKGKPEKIGGNILATSNTFGDYPYGQIKDNKDVATGNYIMVGCSSVVQRIISITSGSPIDVTPLRSATSGTLSNNPFTTVSGSAVVTVAHTAHGILTNDSATFSGAAAVAGVTVNGTYFITKIDANSYTITTSTNASSSTTGGGAAVVYTYYRVTLGASPFSTISGSPIVTVTHTAHGASSGDWVFYTGTSSVAGLTLSGPYQLTKINANSYTINAILNANATTTGGGTPSARYTITIAAIFTNPVWALSRYGNTMLLCPVNGSVGATSASPSTIYVYDSSTPNSQIVKAYPLLNAPTSCNWMFVTPERFVFALGTTNPMAVQWPDQADYTNWTAAANNTANSRTLQEGTFLVGGIVARDFVSMIFSNTAAYTFTYTGDNNIYASQLVGKECGLINPQAVAVFNGTVYWMSLNDLWMWNGSTQKLPSDDIRDYLFTDLMSAISARSDVQNMCRVGINSAKNEVWFWYPSGSDNKNYATRYVIYHIDQNCFSIGTLSVLSYLDRGLFNNPVFGEIDYNLYNSENGTTIQTATDQINTADDVYATFGPLDAENGDKNLDIFGYIPDFERQTGNCQLTIYTSTYPNDPLVTNGPYTLGTSIGRLDVRIGGKLVGGKIENNTVGGDFRLGLPRVEAQEAGGRR